MRSAIVFSLLVLALGTGLGANAALADDDPGKPSHPPTADRSAAAAPKDAAAKDAKPAPSDEPADLDAADLDASDLDSGAGNLSPKLIAEVVKKSSWQVNDCFQRHALKGQGGRLLVEYEIGLDGSVTRADAKESSVQNPVLQTCILSAMKRMKFPAPEGGTVVTSYPFVFG